MELTQFEQKSLEGKYGKGLALAARIILNLGEFFEAPHTVKIRSAQISGVSVKTGGKALERVLDIFIDGGMKTKAPAFLNPAGFDLQRYELMKVDREFHERQQVIINKFVELGVIPSLTCAPYLNGLTAKRGDILAWAESSAVSFANSFLGARTNRESGLSAISAAMLGVTPYYGLLVKEKRAPTLLVDVEEHVEVTGDHLYILGLIIGRARGASIPYIRGIKPDGVTQYKGFGAAMAATGNISLYHVEGETPEWMWAKKMMMKEKELGDLPHLTITPEIMGKELKHIVPQKRPELMVVGCPHAGIEEIIRIDRQLKSKVKDVEFWIFTSLQTRVLAARMGVVGSLKDKGVEIFTDTCMVVSPIENMEFDSVATNSAKALHYLPRTGKVNTVFMPLQEMLRVAQEGDI